MGPLDCLSDSSFYTVLGVWVWEVIAVVFGKLTNLQLQAGCYYTLPSKLQQLPMLSHANSSIGPLISTVLRLNSVPKHISDESVVDNSPYFAFSSLARCSSPTPLRALGTLCQYATSSVIHLRSTSRRPSLGWLTSTSSIRRYMASSFHLELTGDNSSTSMSRSDSYNRPKAKWRYKSSDHCNTTMYICTHNISSN